MKQHTQGRQMLFYGRRPVAALPLLNVARNMNRLNILKAADTVVFRSRPKLSRYFQIRSPGVRISDVGRKELDDTSGGRSGRGKERS